MSALAFELSPANEASVPGLLAIVYGDTPSGRYQASAVTPA